MTLIEWKEDIARHKWAHMIRANFHTVTASIALLMVASCSRQANDEAEAYGSFKMPSALTRGTIKLDFLTDEFEDQFDRKKDDVCTFSAGAGVLLIRTPKRGVAIINDARVELTDNGSNYPVLTGGGYIVSVVEGSPLHKRIADNAADLSVKGPEGEGVFSPGLWTCFPIRDGKRANP